MSQVNVAEKGTVTARMDLNLKKRVLKMKADRAGDVKKPNNVEDIVIAALEEYLKKFGY